jgi:hypothetical protein
MKLITIQDLRRAISGLPSDMPVYLDFGAGAFPVTKAGEGSLHYARNSNGELENVKPIFKIERISPIRKFVESVESAMKFAKEVGFPLRVEPAFVAPHESHLSSEYIVCEEDLSAAVQRALVRSSYHGARIDRMPG